VNSEISVKTCVFRHNNEDRPKCGLLSLYQVGGSNITARLGATCNKVRKHRSGRVEQSIPPFLIITQLGVLLVIVILPSYIMLQVLSIIRGMFVFHVFFLT
jgi:hypothetical protein